LLSLAERILDSKVSSFEPTAFHDRYEEALLAHLKAKQDGVPVAKPSFAVPQRVINLMETLRRSLAEQKPSAAKNGARRRKRA